MKETPDKILTQTIFILHAKPHDYRIIMPTLIMTVISMEFWGSHCRLLSPLHPSLRKGVWLGLEKVGRGGGGGYKNLGNRNTT